MKEVYVSLEKIDSDPVEAAQRQAAQRRRKPPTAPKSDTVTLEQLVELGVCAKEGTHKETGYAFSTPS